MSSFFKNKTIFFLALAALPMCSPAFARVNQNGECGRSDNAPLVQAPTTHLCKEGVASEVSGSGSGPWTWTCAGQGKGVATQCSTGSTQSLYLQSGSITTPQALADQSSTCLGNGAGFPAEWTWAGDAVPAVQPATSGTPKIEQYRGCDPAKSTKCVPLATWQYLGAGTCGGTGDNININPQVSADAGCGPFGRSHYLRSWLPGDIFLVYPAVYNMDDDANQPYVGPMWDNGAEWGNPQYLHYPENIEIRGLVVNGQRPVFVVDSSGGASNTTLGQGLIYIDHGTGVKISNLDIDTTGVANRSISRAGIYIIGSQDLTLSNLRIHGLQWANANGILATGKGTWHLDQLEMFQDGGVPDSAAHPIYISEPAQNDPDFDPNFTVHLTHSWFHDDFYGNQFKSRAPFTYVNGNYFQGGLPQTEIGQGQAENYLLDIPNGGTAVVKDNIFVKNASGYNSNGMSFTYAMEGIPDSRAVSVDVENNTFVALTELFDGQHPVYPMQFYYPGQVPGGPNMPVSQYKVQKNLFVGYCPQNNPVMDFRGDLSVSEGFAQLNPDYSVVARYFSVDNAKINPLNTTSILNHNAYGHVTQPDVHRTINTIGAVD